MTERKGFLDTILDGMETIVDGAEKALRDVPEPGQSAEEMERVVAKREQPQRVIDVPAEVKEQEKPEGVKRQPRRVVLTVQNVSARKRGGVNIIAETPAHDLVCIELSAEDWKKVYDAADWMRMVQDE